MPEIRYVELCTPVPGGGCDAHGPACPAPGKRPLHPDWANHWSHERPSGNTGVLTGPESGLLVIDVDTQEASAQYARWGLPPTFAVLSGRGIPGMHYYFRWPAGLQRVPNRLDGVEIKGPGRQVVAWDSLHKSGQRYKKLGGQFAELPDWFVDRLRESAAQHDHAGVVDAMPEAQRALERLLAVFPDAYEQRDGNWVAHCPAHDDRDPSLVITASGDRLLLVRLKHHIPAIVIDTPSTLRARRAVDERDCATTLILSGRADAVAFEPDPQADARVLADAEVAR